MTCASREKKKNENNDGPFRSFYRYRLLFFAFACSLKRERAVFVCVLGKFMNMRIQKKKYLAWVLLIDVDMLDR